MQLSKLSIMLLKSKERNPNCQAITLLCLQLVLRSTLPNKRSSVKKWHKK